MNIYYPSRREVADQTSRVSSSLHRDPARHKSTLRTTQEPQKPDELLSAARPAQPNHRRGVCALGAKASLHLGPLPNPFSGCRRPAAGCIALAHSENRRTPVPGGLPAHHAAVSLLDVLAGAATTQGRRRNHRAPRGPGAAASAISRSGPPATRPQPIVGCPSSQDSKTDLATVRPGIHLSRSRRAPRRCARSHPAALDLRPQPLRSFYEPAQLTLRS